jgi:hypothetical protein
LLLKVTGLIAEMLFSARVNLLSGILGLLLLGSLSTSAQAGGITVPFGPGEKITFEVGWGFIKAGTSFLSVLDTIRVNDHLCWEIESRAVSNDFLSKLYPVNDSITSIMDSEKLYSRGIRKRLREGRYKSDKEYRIEPENFRVLKIKNEEIADSKPLEHAVQDVLSAFYWVRTRDIHVGDVLHVEAIDNMRTYSLAVKVLKREMVKVRSGKFDCYKIQPIILGEGLFKAKGEVFIWITADERRIPVKMKSKIFIGSISANMIEYIPPNDSTKDGVLP